MNSEISDLTSSQLLSKLDEFKHEAQKAGSKLVELETLARDLKTKVEAVFNEMKRIEIEKGKSYNVANVMASCSPEYKNALEEHSKAEHEYNLAKIEYDLAKSSIRTLEAIGYVRNNELKLARG